MKKIPIASIAILAILVPHLALAQAVITEIMYDPLGTDSGHEWIELYNSGTSAIPLATWKLYEGGSKHNIISASADKTLAPGLYAVIAESAAKFQADYPDFTGQLFHSAFSLDNAGASLELRDASSSVIESIAYDSSAGALGDGNSLQRPPDEAEQFSPHVPTPGAAMSTSVIPAKLKIAPVKASRSKSSSKSSKKSPGKTDASDTSASSYQAATDQTDEVAVPSSQVAAAATAAPSDSYWWLALGALVILTGGAIVASRHFKKTEWDIVEEIPEDV